MVTATWFIKAKTLEQPKYSPNRGIVKQAAYFPLMVSSQCYSGLKKSKITSLNIDVKMHPRNARHIVK